MPTEMQADRPHQHQGRETLECAFGVGHSKDLNEGFKRWRHPEVIPDSALDSIVIGKDQKWFTMSPSVVRSHCMSVSLMTFRVELKEVSRLAFRLL